MPLLPGQAIVFLNIPISLWPTPRAGGWQVSAGVEVGEPCLIVSVIEDESFYCILVLSARGGLGWIHHSNDFTNDHAVVL